MLHFEDSVVVDAPIDHAFDYVADFGNTAKWHKNMKKVGWRSADTPGVGSEYDWVESFMGKTMDLAGVISSWDRPHGFTWRPLDGPYPMSGGWSFESEGDRTRITRFSDSELTGFMKFAAALMVPIAKRQVRQELAALKELIEASSG